MRVLTISGIPRADIDIVLPITIFITNRSRKTVKNPKLFLSYNRVLLMDNKEISTFSSNNGAEPMEEVNKRYLEIRQSQIVYGHAKVEFRLPSIDPGQPGSVMDGIIIRNNIRKVHGKSTFPLDDGDSTAFANFLPQRQDLCFMCYVEANVYAEDLPSWSSFFFIIGYFERTFETSKEAQQVVDAFWLRSGRESEVDGIYFRPWIPFMQTDMRVKAKMLIVKPQFGFLKRDNKKRALAWNPEDTDHYACDFWMPSVNPARIPHQVTNLRQLLQYFGMTPVVRTKTLRHLMDVSNSKINAAKFGLKIAIRFSIGTLARGILNLRRKIPKRDQ